MCGMRVVESRGVREIMYAVHAATDARRRDGGWRRYGAGASPRTNTGISPSGTSTVTVSGPW